MSRSVSLATRKVAPQISVTSTSTRSYFNGFRCDCAASGLAEDCSANRSVFCIIVEIIPAIRSPAQGYQIKQQDDHQQSQDQAHSEFRLLFRQELLSAVLNMNLDKLHITI